MNLSRKDISLILAVIVALSTACVGAWMAYANAGLKQQLKQLKELNRDYQEGIDRLNQARISTEYKAEQLEMQYRKDTTGMAALRFSFDSLGWRLKQIKIYNYVKIEQMAHLNDAATDSLYAINRKRFGP